MEDKVAMDGERILEGYGLTPTIFQEQKLDAIAISRERGCVILLIAPMVWSILVLSEIFERMLGVPGSGIAGVSMLSCIASKALSFLCQTNIQSEESEVRRVTQQLSDICYYMLLSVIGVSMNLRRLAFEGWWSSCSSVMFAIVPLIVHFVVILMGSLGLMRLFPNCKLGIDEIAAASNAAICGPFTAAALIAKLSSGDRKDSPDSLSTRWKGLALAATFWGIVGYAIATYIGVSVSKALL